MITLTYKMMSIGQFAQKLGVSVPTIRRWGKTGKRQETYRTIGGHRRFSQQSLWSLLGLKKDRKSVGYARVSAHDQKKDLATQSDFLSRHSDHVITDIGSGLNCKKSGLRKLLALLLDRQISTLHLTHTDRLLRFGHERVFQICRWAGTDVVIHNAPKVMSFEEELCQDVLTLMAVFSGRLHGKRSHQHKKLHPAP